MIFHLHITLGLQNLSTNKVVVARGYAQEDALTLPSGYHIIQNTPF